MAQIIICVANEMLIYIQLRQHFVVQLFLATCTSDSKWK